MEKEFEQRNGQTHVMEMKWARRAVCWRDDLIVLLMLTGFAFWVNRGMEIRGLYMDDLYLWSCFGEQSFSEFVFPLGSTRFRFVYYLAAWLELLITGAHVEWFVPINILLNVAVGFSLYRMAKKFSRSVYVAALCSAAFLASRMAYYQIGQVYGLMETMALWMALGILYLLCGYLNEDPDKKSRKFMTACLLYFGVCFVHERYMVLIVLFLLAVLWKERKNWKLWTAAAGTFLAVQGIRLATIGGLSPAGTGGTDVADTFSIGQALRFVISQVAYLFGINAGPEHLNGQNFREAPLVIMVLIALADLMLIGVTVAFVMRLIQNRKGMLSSLGTALLFLCFIGGCIACSSVTIRVEMRWVYVSYGAALLFLSWMYGMLTKDMAERGRFMQAVPFLVMISLYVIFMLPVELYYRNLYPKLYYWQDQERYNSLAEVTYGTYGNDIFGKTIYIVGDSYEMSDFTADTFFKVFDPERKAEGTQVIFLDDVREIGLITDDMLVLAEDPAHDRFLDITQGVREFKCRSLYGYYEDGWMDERAEIQLMAGSTGNIELEFYYPGEIQKEQWISIYVDGEAQSYLGIEENLMRTSLSVAPYQVVNLKFETNFYVPDAQEQRGEKKLAAVLTIRAD